MSTPNLDLDKLIDRFDCAWQVGPAPDIAEYVDSATERDLRNLLHELIAIDLEQRWKRDPGTAIGELPDQPTLEDYCSAFSVLGDPRRLPLDLIAEEYRVRKRWGDQPDHGIFLERFDAPGVREQLAAIDEELTAEEADGTRTVPDSLAPPSTRPRLPGYEVLGELGDGGMGVVYKAKQLSLGRVVALKTILQGGHARAALVERFRREAEAVARLNSENIVRIYDFGEHDGVPFFTMEYVAGGTLASRIVGERPVPHACARLVTRLARTMHEVHTRGQILHRDLKPSNVLLQGEPDTPLDHCGPKISDFGLVKLLDDQTDATPTDAVLGTPSYMAPEQAKSDPVDARTDVYALGAILYECLTGRPPFRASTPMGTIRQVLEEEPTPPRRIDPKIPADLETICLHCLHKEPAQRYASAAALADDLDRFLGGFPIQARPVTRTERVWRWARRHPALATSFVLGAFAIVFGVLGAGTTWLWQRAEAARRDADHLREQETRARERADALRVEVAHAKDDLEQLSYTRDVDLAHREYQAGNITRALQLLDGCPADRRRWEWHYVNGLCRSEDVSCIGHTEGVPCVAFSPDGKLLASASYDHTAKLWDADTGRELRTFAGHTKPLRAVAFAIDGKRIATGSSDGTARIWDVATGNTLVTIEPELPFGQIQPRVVRPNQASPTSISALAFSPDGKELATTPLSAGVVIWDAATGKRLRAMEDPKNPGQELRGGLRSVAYSPDGQQLAGVFFGWAHNVIVWEASTGKHLRTLKGPEGLIDHVAFSPDGKQLAGASIDNTATVWDLDTGKSLRLRGHSDSVNGIAFSPNGKWIATASKDRTVKLWSADTGKILVTHQGHTQSVECVAFRQDSQRLASSSAGPQPGSLVRVGEPTPGEIKVWTPLSWPGPRQLLRTRGTVSQLDSSGRRLALARHDGGVEIWTVDGQRVSEMLPSGQVNDANQRTEINALRFTSDGKRLVIVSTTASIPTGQNRAELHVFDAMGKRVGQPQPLPGPQRRNYMPSGCFDSDARHLAYAWHGDNRVWIWDVAEARLAKTIDCRFPRTDISRVALSPDGERLAVGSNDGRFAVWDLHSGKQHFEHELRGGVGQLAFSPDGDLLAVCPYIPLVPGEIQLRHVPSGNLLHSLKGHTQEVTCLDFDANGERLVSADQRSTFKLWDTATGLEIVTLSSSFARREGLPQSIRFGGDRQRLFAAFGPTVYVWKAKPQKGTTP